IGCAAIGHAEHLVLLTVRAARARRAHFALSARVATRAAIGVVGVRLHADGSRVVHAERARARAGGAAFAADACVTGRALGIAVAAVARIGAGIYAYAGAHGRTAAALCRALAIHTGLARFAGRAAGAAIGVVGLGVRAGLAARHLVLRAVGRTRPHRAN